MDASLDQYKDLKLKLSGFVPPGEAFKRNMLLDMMYASLPRDPQAKVQIYNAEILPGGFTNWHQHNGPAFFVALQGLFEATSRKARWSRRKPANAMSSRSPNSTAGTIRTRTCPICASASP